MASPTEPRRLRAANGSVAWCPRICCAWEKIRSRALRERREEYSGEYRIVRPGGDIRSIEARVFVSYNGDGRPQRVVGVDIDVTERKRAEDHQRMLAAELDHRVKNVLAVVSAVAAQTRDASSSMDHFVAAFDGRIQAMASTHELLSGRRWQGIPLKELFRRQLAPYSTYDNTSIGGPEVLLLAEAGQALALVIHELTTNAAKHGALSTRAGLVTVRWRFADASGRLIIEWQEAGRSASGTPGKPGYGTSVIQAAPALRAGWRCRVRHHCNGSQVPDRDSRQMDCGRPPVEWQREATVDDAETHPRAGRITAIATGPLLPTPAPYDARRARICRW